ncbi:MAG: DsbA family protein [Candidatus Pseudobacter hemicellulosilyticus]|uniref:DsbA family protein n=1 Tax=Candidatus Pseudobacter hemicellulosilyticus TaxID=3121375 RepID=A0AAJ6BJC3_9BACT|nr:MAG: DsbA family protein [Pseudobacter sp.]
MAMHKAKIVEIIPPKDIWQGPANAPVALVEFGDYESEACARVHEVVKKLLQTFEGDLKFCFRHFPLTQIHQRAQKAAEAAVAASQEGKFWDMHELLFRYRRSLGSASLKEYAREAGVTDKNILPKLVDSLYGWTVRNDLLEGLEKGVRDVPAFFINGEPLTGKPTYENLRKAIEEVLKQGKKKTKTAVRQRA